MKAEIKSVDLGSEIGVFEYTPEYPNSFCLWMTFTIGRIGGVGGDLFRIKVCTPDWLKLNVGNMSWGRHILVVNNGYRPQEIIDYVGEFVSSIDEKDWPGLAEKISRVMEWEFEDYV